MSPFDWTNKFIEKTKAKPYDPTLPFANGFLYIFTVYDDEPEEKEETYEGKPTTPKFHWKIHYLNIKVKDQLDIDILARDNEKTLIFIKDYENNKDVSMKLPKKASNEFSQFIQDNKCTEKTKISVYRTGRSSKTKYHFEVVK